MGRKQIYLSRRIEEEMRQEAFRLSIPFSELIVRCFDYYRSEQLKNKKTNSIAEWFKPRHP
jgi:hypothetical protein